MMKLIFELIKSNIDLAIDEISAFENGKKFELIDNYLIIDTDKDLSNRLGFSNKIFKLLFSIKTDKLEHKINNCNWNFEYEKNFCVRVINGAKTYERKLSSLIWKKLNNPAVNLKNPKTLFIFIFHKEHVYCGKFLLNVDKSYLMRKAHLRPVLHPTSIHPRLARAVINLTGLTKGKIIDPFCGSGGILIEAGLMGFSVVGYDLYDYQIKKAKKNLEHYGIINYVLKKVNALNISGKYDAIVTDLPYGKNSKANKLNNLYLNFLKKIYDVTNISVVIFPNWIDSKKIISITDWNIKNTYQIYIHKSLTRNIYVLTKKN